MAKKPNFGFEKRQKDLKKQQKREEKAEKKRLKREGDGGGDVPQADGADDFVPGDPESTP